MLRRIPRPFFSDAVASFLSTIGGGFEVIMATTYLADEIAEYGEEECEEEPMYAYIKEKLLKKDFSAQ